MFPFLMTPALSAGPKPPGKPQPLPSNWYLPE